jgi:putative ABC transport system permease protein
MWRRRRSQQNFNAEIEAHLQLEMDRLMEEGATESEARAAARRTFGNLTKVQERFYESRRWLWTDHVLRDVRYAARMLRKNPGLTAVVLLTMALGIGASTAIFTVVNAVLLRPLPYPQPERLVMCLQRHTQFGPETVTLPDYRDWRDGSTRFEGLAGAWANQNFNLTDIDEPERVPGASVIGNLFRVLGTAPLHGRTIADDQERDVVVIGYGLWQRRFGGQREVVGKSIKLNGRPHTVIGVMPAGFAFPATAEVWVPLVPQPTMDRGYHQLWVIGRLKQGSTVEQAGMELRALAARAEREHPSTNKNWTAEVSALGDHVVGSARRSLLVLAGATGCLLLLACANVAGLLTSRSVTRRQEMAVRTAVGAVRWQIVRQLLVESLLLSLCGGVLGLLLAVWAIEPLLRLTTLPRANEVSLDLAVVVFAIVASIGTGIVFGLMPALAAANSSSRSDLNSRGGTSAVRLRPVLVALQIAIATVLLAGAGLLMKSFHRLQQVDTGFSGDGVLAARFFVPRAMYPAERCAPLYQQMIERMRRLPGVESAAAVSSLPFSGVNANAVFDMPGRPPAPAGSPYTAEFRAATPHYFRTLAIPMLSGRDFAATDSADSQFVAVVNRAMVDRYFEGRDPIGHFVRIIGPKPRMIIGVVGNIRHRRLDSAPEPEIYVPHTQFPTGGMFLAVRTRYDDPLTLASAVRAEVKDLDRNLPMTPVRTLTALLDETLSTRRFSLILLTLFATTALVLAIVGSYGMVAFSVSQRAKEIGIRMALGAAAGEVVRSTVRGGMLPVAIGLTAGLAGALAATRVLSNQLFEIRPNDPPTMAGVAGLLLCAALVACLLPSLRAARVDPMIALREE